MTLIVTVSDALRPRLSETVTVAGTGARGFSGDGGTATSAQLSEPLRVAVDPSGNLYIAYTGNGEESRTIDKSVNSSKGIRESSPKKRN